MKKEQKNPDQSFRDSKTILFTGVKGGCGCSFIANSVAAYLARTKNISVILVDFNTGKNDSRTVFNLSGDSIRDLGDIVCDFSEIDISLLKKLVINFDNSFNLVLPSTKFEKANIFTGKDIENLLGSLANFFDIIIADFPFYLFIEVKNTYPDFADKIVFISSADFISANNLKLLINNVYEDSLSSKVDIIINKFNSRILVSSQRVVNSIPLPVKAFIPYDRDLEYLYMTRGPFPMFDYTLRTVRAISDFSECLFEDLF